MYTPVYRCNVRAQIWRARGSAGRGAEVMMIILMDVYLYWLELYIYIITIIIIIMNSLPKQCNYS